MLIEVTENRWILASSVSEVICYQKDHTHRWVVIIETKDETFDVEFEDEEPARLHCLNLVAKINGEQNNGKLGTL
jgi:hypothetical protein